MKSRIATIEDAVVSIIGVGLMGGSYLKALNASIKRPKKLIAYDIDENVRKAANKYCDISTGDAEQALINTDLVVLCLNPKTAVEFVEKNSCYMKANSTVTDICGVKQFTIDKIPSLLPDDVIYVGGHPMAGREHRGFSQSNERLFFGCRYILVDQGQDITLAKELAIAIGAGKIVYSTPKKHDELIAYTSQLPHVLSIAYMLGAGDRDVEDFSAGSFRDFTRVAMINEKMWSELFLINKEQLVQEIKRLVNNLNNISDMIDNDAQETMENIMRTAADMREKIKEQR